MDTVIFTGHVPVDKYKEDRQREIKELKDEDKLEKKIKTRNFSKLRMKIIRSFGFFFVISGTILVILIIYSLLFG